MLFYRLHGGVGAFSIRSAFRGRMQHIYSHARARSSHLQIRLLLISEKQYQESLRLPGSGCDIEIFPLLQNYLRYASPETGDVNSMNHLRDLLSALESIREGSNPSVGLSHKLSGWLAQPLEKWPNFTLEMIMDGDIDVSESLILRKSGFHEGLRNIDSSAQPLGS